MNQILETRSGHAVMSGFHPFILGEDPESTVVVPRAGDQSFPIAIFGTVPKKRRVLLIESDACLQESLTNDLAETGYTVVAFHNSSDALKAVLADDFALVLYDVMTPGLRGDMLYNSVERIDPELCERFVFMTCDDMDGSTAEFIRNINGFVLRKPFESLDLLDLILSAEAHGTFEGVFGRASFIPHAPAPGHGPRRAAAGTGARDKSVAHAVYTAPSKQGQVLLIEGDACFREKLRYYLAETGYTVMAFQNSRDALKEVLAADFALILYDPMTAGLPAEMFYQGVRRVDAELSERMVFMTGDGNDAATGAFIRKIDGFVLRKPFDAKILGEKISATEVLGTLHGAFESSLSDTELSHACLPVEDESAPREPRPHVAWFAETQTGVILSEQTDSIITQETPLPEVFGTPIRLSAVIPAIEPPVRLHGVWRMVAFAALALLGGLVVVRWSQHRDARDSAAAASAKREAIEEEWMETSRNLRAANAMRPKIEAEIRKLGRFAENQSMPRWSPSLRFLVPAREAKIDILEVSASGHKEDLGACEVRIRGVAGGSESRLVAERFQQAVEASFKQNANGRRATVRFERLEELPGASPDQYRAAFVMIATVEPIKASTLITGEGR